MPTGNYITRESPNKDRSRNIKHKIRKKDKHDLLVCLQILSLQESAVDNKIIQFEFILNKYRREKKKKGGS